MWQKAEDEAKMAVDQPNPPANANDYQTKVW